MSDLVNNASFSGIPTELRVAIFEYIVLPLADVQLTTDILCPTTLYGSRPIRPAIKLRTDQRWHLDILRVNRQCNAEASYVLYKRTLSIGISESSFTQDPLEGYRIQCCMAKAEARRLSYAWLPEYCGIPKSNLQFLKTLELVIEPSNMYGHWYAIRSSMRSFCDQNNCVSLKNFRVKLMDMMRSSIDALIHHGWHSVLMHEAAQDPMKAAFKDYATTLQEFRPMAVMAQKCDIFLPYWMEADVEAANLKAAWENEPSVKMHFMPLGTWSGLANKREAMHRTLAVSQYQTPVPGRPQNHHLYFRADSSPRDPKPDDVREGYFFLADLIERKKKREIAMQ